MIRTEIERLEEQLRLSFEGEAWHGPSVMEALAGVSAADAWAHPIAGAHSVWELVHHLAGTYRLVLRRIEGNGAPLAMEEDWPPVSDPTEDRWLSAVRSLRELNLQLRGAVRLFDPQALDEPLVPERSYSAYAHFIGITQHDVYHAGQIVLLKRALAARR